MNCGQICICVETPQIYTMHIQAHHCAINTSHAAKRPNLTRVPFISKLSPRHNIRVRKYVRQPQPGSQLLSRSTQRVCNSKPRANKLHMSSPNATALDVLYHDHKFAFAIDMCYSSYGVTSQWTHRTAQQAPKNMRQTRRNSTEPSSGVPKSMD